MLQARGRWRFEGSPTFSRCKRLVRILFNVLVADPNKSDNSQGTATHTLQHFEHLCPCVASVTPWRNALLEVAHSYSQTVPCTFAEGVDRAVRVTCLSISLLSVCCEVHVVNHILGRTLWCAFCSSFGLAISTRKGTPSCSTVSGQSKLGVCLYLHSPRIGSLWNFLPAWPTCPAPSISSATLGYLWMPPSQTGAP